MVPSEPMPDCGAARMDEARTGQLDRGDAERSGAAPHMGRRGRRVTSLRGLATLVAISCVAASGACFGQQDAFTQLPAEAKPSLVIEGATAGGRLSRQPLTARAGEKLQLRIANTQQIAAESEIRWYQIVPDTSRYYKNANHP